MWSLAIDMAFRGLESLNHAAGALCLPALSYRLKTTAADWSPDVMTLKAIPFQCRSAGRSRDVEK